MGEITADIKKVIESKSIGEMFRNIPWGFIELLAAVPALIYAVVPLIQFIVNFGSIYAFSETIYECDQKILVFFAVLLVLMTGKSIAEGKNELLAKDSLRVYGFFLIFLLLMIISTFVNGFTDYALNGEIYRNESLFTYIKYFAVIFFSASLIKSGKLKRLILYTHLISGTIISVAAFVHNHIHTILQFCQNDGVSAIFRNLNHFAYYLTTVILVSSVLFVLERKKVLKAVSLSVFVINSYVIIMNNTFGCYLACIAGMSFFLIIMRIMKRKTNFTAVLPLIIFIVLSIAEGILYGNVLANFISTLFDMNSIVNDTETADSAGSGRWKLWTETVKYIGEAPLIGHGVEGIADRLFEVANNTRTHNEYLQYAAFFGIPAALVYVAGVMCVFLNGLKNKMKLDICTIAAITAAFGYLVSAFFGNTMYYTTPYLFILLGLGCVPDIKNDLQY